MNPGDTVAYVDYTYGKRFATILRTYGTWVRVKTDLGHHRTMKLAKLRVIKRAA